MTQVRTRIRASKGHRISGVAPADVPAGEHEVLITVQSRPRRRVADLPVHPGDWDDRISLRRGDIYDDDAR
jgi:hypothetical protein